MMRRKAFGEGKKWSKATTSSVKHGGGRVIAETCMAANGTESLVFIDDVSSVANSRMNSEVYRAPLSQLISVCVDK